MGEKFEVDEGLIWAEFAKMRIPHPRIAGVHKKLNAARRAASLSPREPRRYIEFFAPSHTGKSTAIKTYIEDVVVDQAIERGMFPDGMDRSEIAEQQKLVLHVTLSQKATVKTLATDILDQLGDPQPDRGTGSALMVRVYKMLAAKKVELVVLDEIQHLSATTSRQPDGGKKKSHEVESTVVTDALKTMMIRGLVPMVLVGVPEAREHLAIDVQLTNRELAKIDFSPLRWSDAEDRKVFLFYVSAVAIQMQKHGVVPEESSFLKGDIPHLLWAASAGCIGVVSRIAEQAAIHALERGATKVEREDLSLAVDTRAIPNNMSTYNPFRTGLRGLGFDGQ